jgi:guanidinobutyrase
MESTLTALEALKNLLSPHGIFTVSAGSENLSDYYQKRYGSDNPEKIQKSFIKELEKISSSKVIVLGIPNDNGAGMDRGSKKAPFELRKRLFLNSKTNDQLKQFGVIDIGDVWDHPLLVDDTMYKDWVLEQVRVFRWPQLVEKGISLPVAPQSILREVIKHIYTLNPKARILLMGGDHSHSKIPIEARLASFPDEKGNLGILQIDAHTDLSSYRQGLTSSYSTWAYWANELIGKNQRLVQLGIRQSTKDKAYWEESLDVKQYWSKDISTNSSSNIISQVIDHYHDIGVEKLYISIDIDGLCPDFAAATGTPEPNGLTPLFVKSLLQELQKVFDIVGADLMEVAPSLARGIPEEPERTLNTATSLILEEIQALVSHYSL